MSINNCAYCNKYPKVLELISCENKLCEDFGVEYFVYDWQVIEPANQVVETSRPVTAGDIERIRNLTSEEKAYYAK